MHCHRRPSSTMTSNLPYLTLTCDYYRDRDRYRYRYLVDWYDTFESNRPIELD